MGLSKTGLNIINFITAYYQNAQFKEIYDTYKAGHIVNINGKNYKILSPDKDNLNKPYFIFVALNSASKIAEVLFGELDKKDFFLCRLEFIKKEMIESRCFFQKRLHTQIHLLN